jgi:hypothetical protein
VSELRRSRPHGVGLLGSIPYPAARFISPPRPWPSCRPGLSDRASRGPRAAALETWLEQVARSWNILPMDGPASRLWAKLMHRRWDDLIENAMIAATALNRGFTVVTRNIRDFVVFDVPLLDLFAAPRRG